MQASVLTKHILNFSVLLAFACGSALAQTGTITGTITDSTGAVMPEVAITVTNTATNQSRSVSSDGSGGYVAPLLPIGQYRVEGSREGFQKAAATNVTLNVSETVRVDLKLMPGAVNQTIEVTGAATLVQSETATVGNVIDTQKVSDLPLNGRRFESLALLVPGIATNNPSPSNGGAISISAGGGRFSSNNFRLDGVNNVAEGGGTGIALRPIIDAIQEFKIQTNSYSSEFGRGGGANIQVATKSGSNAFHGNVWEFFRNDRLDAKGYFDIQKQSYRRNQFGNTFGGPIRKDKTFFFFAYEGLRRYTAVAARNSVPTDAFRSGDFRALTAALKDPVNGGTFAGNQIPVSRFNAGALAILQYYPHPTAGLTGASNFQARNAQADDQDQFNARIDHRVSSSNQLFGRFSTNKNVALNPCTGAGTACIPGFPTSARGRTSQLALSDTHILTAQLVNEFRAGLNRVANINVTTASSLIEGKNIAGSLGIQGFPSSPNPVDWGMQNIAITGYGGLNSQDYNPNFATTYNISDTLSWVHNEHSVRAGIDLGRQYYFAAVGRARDGLTFDGRFTGNAFADFLLGYLSQTVQNPSDFVRYRISNTYAAFAQDDWKIRKNLTLNLGVRYDYQSPDYEKQNRAVNINYDTYKVEIAGQNGASRSLYNPDRRNFAPRFGFAYRPQTGLVVRGGYGWFYDVALQGAQLGQVKQGPPFFTNSTYNASANPLDLTLVNPFPAGRLQATTIYDYRSIQTNFKNGIVQQYNFGVQKSAGNNMVVEVGYIGSRGTRLYRNVDINQAVLGTTLVQTRRPLPQYGSLLMMQSQAQSNYNALIARFERRFSGGMTLLTSYTWSHSIDNFSNSNPNGTGGQNVRDFRSERASSDFDTRQRLAVSYVYELPFGRSRRFLSKLPAVGDVLIGGWQFSGVSQFQSGNPLNVAIQGSRSNTGTTNLDRPDATGISPQLNSTDKTYFLNPAAYTLQALNTFGNAARNTATGPGFISSDFTISKRVHKENWVTEIRAELFNAFNHPLLANPVVFANSPVFGRIQSTRSDQRQIQFGLKVSR